MHHWSLDADAAVVEKNISKKNLNTWYEAQQAIDRGRTKKVYCYISPKVRSSQGNIFVGTKPQCMCTKSSLSCM